MKTDYNKIYAYLSQSLNLERLEETGLPLTTESEKWATLKHCFDSEYGFALERMNHQAAFAEWLSGLCGAVDIPYMNIDIIELAKSWGGLPYNATESQENRILNNYWSFMAFNYYKLAKKHGVILF